MLVDRTLTRGERFALKALRVRAFTAPNARGKFGDLARCLRSGFGNKVGASDHPNLKGELEDLARRLRSGFGSKVGAPDRPDPSPPLPVKVLTRRFRFGFGNEVGAPDHLNPRGKLGDLARRFRSGF